MKRMLLSFIFAACAVVPAMAQTDAVLQGKAAYDKTCTACHGANGGPGDRAPAIVNSRAAAMRGQRSDAQLVAIIRNGIAGTGMPAWAGRLSDDDIVKIGAYIHALRGTAIDNPLPGDALRGEQVFWGKGDCGGCHMISGRGGVLGPDLTTIASVRKAVSISDALTKAEHRVYGDGGVHLPMIPPMDYNPVRVVTRGGEPIDGLMLNQDAYSVQVMGMDSRLHLFDRANLRSVTLKPGSIMPSDYDKRLAPDELQDLLAFLTRQGAVSNPSSGKGAQ